MKKIIFNLLVISFLILVPVFAATASAPPPPPPGGPGTGDAPIGGTAPLGSGIVMLLTMGAAYGAKKVYDARKKLQEKE